MTKFRNKYTRSRYSFKDATAIKLSESILKFVSGLPKFRGGLIQRLQRMDEFRKRRAFTVKKPDDLEVALLQVWIFETVYIEDLGILKSGLQNFLDDFQNARFLVLPFRIEKLDETFESIENTILGSSWHNIGTVDVAGNSGVCKSQWIDNFHIFIQHFYPSFVTIGISLDPTADFKQLIADTIAKEFNDRTVLRKPFLGWTRLKFLGNSQTPASLVKSEFIEDLMLEFKTEATNIISPYFQGIFLKRGKPIPSIELFKEKKLPIEPQAGPIDERNLFWESVGMEKVRFRYFENKEEGVSLFPPGASFHRKKIDKPHRILIAESQIKPKNGDHDIDSDIIDSVEQQVEGLLPLMLFHELTEDLLKEVHHFKRELFRIIRRKKTKTLFRRIALTNLTNMKLRINETYSIFQRLVLEFDKAKIKNHAKHSGLPELKNADDDSIEYISSILDYAVFKTQNAEKNFAVINSAMNELLQAKYIQSGDKIQRRVLWLTWVMTALAVVAVLPEEKKIAVFHALSDGLRSLFMHMLR